jgi:phospholipid/cholesterol/gamma-HCH transport system substrate-binding protein
METRSNHILVGGVVLALIVAVLAFIIWLSQAAGEDNYEYDIFFKQAVDGLARGSAVTFSGVPVGQVASINLEPKTPEFVRVRIAVQPNTPITRGTSATIQSVGFTGVSQIQLDGAVRGAPPLTQAGPYGVPVIPAKPGGFAALLNTAPELLNRVSTLTERLTELLSDRNQARSPTSRNVEESADRVPTARPRSPRPWPRRGSRSARRGAADRSAGCDASDRLLNGRPAADQRPRPRSVPPSPACRVDASWAKPAGVQALTKQTIPEVGQLVGTCARPPTPSAIPQRRARRALPSRRQKLPDYEPKK